MTNSEIVLAATQALESDHPESAAKYYSDDFICLGGTPPKLNRDQYLGIIIAGKKGFPDFTQNLKILSETDDTVRTISEPVGTHTGVFSLPGLPPLQPTGHTVALPRQVLEFTVADGKIKTLKLEAASGGCLMDILEQLGVMMDEEFLTKMFKPPE